MTTLTPYLLLILCTLFVLVILQRLLFRHLTHQVGYRSIYISAIIGTPIHELSHAIMCFIFGHKIVQIKFFSPDNKGTLGFVTHSYNNRSVWHVLGNFFIGIAPIIGGAVCLYLLCLFLLPSGTGVLGILLNKTHVLSSNQPLTDIIHLLTSLKNSILNDAQNKPVQTFIWAYLCGGVALHLTPSKEDLKGSLWGFLLFSAITTTAIVITHHFTLDVSVFILGLTSILHTLSMMLIFALAFAFILLIFIGFISFIFNALFSRY